MCFAALPASTLACTGIYAGSNATKNGSVYVGRSEDFGPDYGKRFIIVPAADHAAGEMLADDHGFCAPYPAHTLRYSAVIDDPSASMSQHGYYRVDDNGVYRDRYGKEVNAETAEAVLRYLSGDEFTDGLRDFMSSVQEAINARAASDDKRMIRFAGAASDEEVSAMADQLAYENSAYIKRIASEKLAEIDEYVSEYITSISRE